VFRIRKLLLFATLISVTIIIFLVYYFFFNDEYFFIKPLPQDISLEIRMDAYGDGYFGAARKGNRKHRGIDLLAPLNTPVLVVKSGVVIETGYDEYCGYYVVAWHWPSLKSYYLHLSEIAVKKYQLVKQGQVIGKVGKTGNARYKGIRPHLHFEIRENNIAQDILKRWRLNLLIKSK
jgi:murein DD-endopeptidase MepM/ murein hydrolase activator NlpD